MGVPLIEPLADPGRLNSVRPLERDELEIGLRRCLAQIDANMAIFGDGSFPTPAAQGGLYKPMGNEEWTNGFWTGQLWLAYELTGDMRYRNLAEQNVKSFLDRVERRHELDHHDLGFLYIPSCVAAFKVCGSEAGRRAALLAADQLMTRWQGKGRFFQAWGPMNSPEHYRFIIDCLLNVPLLYWASEMSGDPIYAECARNHFMTTCAHIIRSDGSAFHTFYMDPVTGGPSRGATRQGYSDDSAWARGQAWGIDGIPINIRHTGMDGYADYARSMRNYFLNRLPEDSVCFWDLIFQDGSGQPRDSSAAAIAVCGLDEMAQLEKSAEERLIDENAGTSILRSLIFDYMSDEAVPGAPILCHGVYSWHSGKGVDEGNLWGDYFVFEAIARKLVKWNPYW
ncbi:MAG: glucuronyl hydrolase [Coriobacteriaceae bacterium]|jgi:unsaturated chondroitin disaccharide hydrolase|nr:MAG: glucuronyl hydrolase [Coriobacteriaceae bacterium]